jgi:hypothetical protein
MSWSSPILVENKGRVELILTDNKSVCSYDPKTGRRYWRVECLDGEVAASAAYAGGIVFVAVEGSAASAEDIAGKWHAQFDTVIGIQTYHFHFQAIHGSAPHERHAA